MTMPMMEEAMNPVNYDSWLLTGLIVLAVAGAAIIWLLPATSRHLARYIALAFSVVGLGGVVYMLTQFDFDNAGAHQFTELTSWIPQIGASYALGVNGIGLLMIAMQAVLVPIVIVAAWRENGPQRARHYFALILLLQAFMIGIFAARDVFLFYVIFEAMLIPVYFLIGYFGKERRREAAVKFLLYSLAGGLIMLVAVIALYVAGPGGERGFLISSLTDIGLSQGAERWIFVGFFIAFAIKAPMFPVHTWLPDSAAAAKPGTSTLLVGVLDKVGTFGMMTLCLPLFPNASKWAAPVIIGLALISIIYGALLAIGQRDIMRMIAFTSVSHFGFIVLGIFAFTQVSMEGSALYMFNHGISTGLMFLVAGFLIVRRRSQDIDAFGGVQKVAPLLAGVFLISMLSALSLPGLSTFVSEIMVLIGTFGHSVTAGVIAAFGVVLAAIYALRTYQRVATGPITHATSDMKDLRRREKVVVAPLVALLLFFGFYPAPALDMVRDGASDLVATVQVAVPEASGIEEGGDE